MKELIKKRWFVFLLGILIVVIVLLIFGLILYCNGYRITYPQQFETSWDAVSGFAAWFGVAVSILSAGASFYAIWSAIQISDKQNKIELFERRLNCYNEFSKHASLALYTKIHKNPEVIIPFFKYIFEIPTELDLKKYPFDYFQKSNDILRQIPLVFPSIDSAEVSEIIFLFSTLTHYFIYAEDTSIDIQKEYSEKVRAFQKKYENLMKESLKLED